MSPSTRIFFESTKIHLKMMFVCELMFLPPYIESKRASGLTPHCLKQSSEYSFMFHEWGSNMSSTPSEQVGMTISVLYLKKQIRKDSSEKMKHKEWNTLLSYSSEAKKWGFELSSLASEPLFSTPYHLSLFLRLSWEVTEVGAIYSFTNYFTSYLLSYWILKTTLEEHIAIIITIVIVQMKMEAQIESS